MGIVKVLKTKAYFKRYQVKFRRRRQCKTDYQARGRLIVQDKRKYNSQKYRLVVRVTNRDVICQIVGARVDKDEVLAAAYASELKQYGLSVGLTNYAACYCTGLLLARRALKKFGLDKFYVGKEEVDGEDIFNTAENVEWGDDDHERNAFRCYFDVGLARTTTGARIFGALKGAVDGGLDVPLKGTRFPGSVPAGEDDDNDGTDPETHRKYIFGGHVADYMTKLKEEEPEKYEKQFSKYIAAGVGPDDLEDLYAKVHAGIRANPDRAAKKTVDKSSMKSWPRPKKQTLQQRRDKVLAKIAALKERAKEAEMEE